MNISLESLVGKYIYACCPYFVRKGENVPLRKMKLHAIETAGVWVEDEDFWKPWPAMAGTPVFIPFPHMALISPFVEAPQHLGPVLVMPISS